MVRLEKGGSMGSKNFSISVAMETLRDYYFPSIEKISLLSKVEERDLLRKIDPYTHALRLLEKILREGERGNLDLKSRRCLTEKLPLNLLNCFLTKKFPFRVFSQREKIIIKDAIKKMRRYHQRVMPLMEKLVISNLRLVVLIVEKYVGRNDIEELVFDGNLGLCRAVEMFDYRFHSTRFNTYAGVVIKRYIEDGIYDNSRTIRIPHYIYSKKGEELYKKTVNLSDEVSLEQFQLPWISKRLYDDEHLLGVEPAIEKSSLNKNEKRVISMRFGLNGHQSMTLEEIGQGLNLTRERIRQIESRALQKLGRDKKLQKIYQLGISS